MGDGLGDFAFWAAIGVIGLALLNGPIGRAVAARLQGRKAASADEGRVRESRREWRIWSKPQARLAEIEERLDFNERMLASQRDAARLGEGSQ